MLALEFVMVFSSLDWMARSGPRLRAAGSGGAESRDPFVGRWLHGSRVLKRIGQGSAGVVYLAEHAQLGRKVAIKIMRPQWSAADDAGLRFRREARVSALVRNQHIVDVYDIGCLQEGPLCLVMEFLEGSDVARLVAAEGRLCVPRVADIGLQICSALEAVHAAGVVHRDLKPEHVFLTARGHIADFVKVVDFGLCKVLSDPSITAAGIALGTPRCMAPEQLEARPDVGASADVYALGGILFFMLTGRCPFEADTLPALLMRVWSKPAPRLRELRPDAPECLDRLLERALSKDASARPSLREFNATLAPFAPSLSAHA